MRQIWGKLTKELNQHTDIKSVSRDPGFTVNTYRELVEQVAKLSYYNKDYLLFYRGQAVDYKNKADKSTFYPTIYRDELNYLKQQELDYRFELLNVASKMLSEVFLKKNIEGRNELRRKKFVQWSILQHYEVVKTPLIDVTQSLRVACSFALQDNNKEYAYVYIFGLPYITNRISINSEHDLVNIRLLSITPPTALRPYFQEGFLVGTEDITNEYEDKSELDLNNRLIAKFKIPNNDSFWGNDFKVIPHNALYPNHDYIESICSEIKLKVDSEATNSDFGAFLKLWTQLEQKLLKKARKNDENINTIRDALYVLKKYDQGQDSIINDIENLKMFRNKLVRKPTDISSSELKKYINILENIHNALF